MMEMDGDWCEERPTLIDSYGWALNPECFYLKLPITLRIRHGMTTGFSNKNISPKVICIKSGNMMIHFVRPKFQCGNVCSV